MKAHAVLINAINNFNGPITPDQLKDLTGISTSLISNIMVTAVYWGEVDQIGRNDDRHIYYVRRAPSRRALLQQPWDKPLAA